MFQLFSAIKMRPIDRDPLPACESIVKKQFLVPATVFVHQAGYFDIETAVLSDLGESSFAPPANGVETRGRFLYAERCLSDRIEPEAMAKFCFHLEHEIGSWKLMDEIE